MMEEDIRKIWEECFFSLFNESPSNESRPEGRGKLRALAQIDILTATTRGSTKEKRGVKQLTCLFNKIFSSAKMPDKWRLSEVIPVYKNKGDAQACSNYRGIKVISHAMKLWERFIERRLKRETRVLENQFGFMSGRVLVDHKSSSKHGRNGRIKNVKVREERLRWFGHVKKRPQTDPVRRVEALLVEGARRRGKPKLR
ncbi:hypothetical protein Tco_1411923 [Tanacetum coccineum]